MTLRTLHAAVLTVIILMTGIVSRAQLSVNPGTAISLTPLDFVQTYLVGTGVIVSNATFNGSSEPLNSTNRTPLKYRDQIGSFTTTNGALAQLGIPGGVLLSTGYTQNAIAPNNPSEDMQGNNQPAESDPDLQILANNTINDKSVLEFDFIPSTEVVTFRYVFSSLEFDGFCGSYNDAFGLFLSGPGISGGGGFTNNAKNIAILPESVAPVNIFNICAADEGNLGNGIYSWWNGAHTYFSYNRLTYVLTATYPVQCNQTYHMKFAIGDAGDGAWDSGVFLEQNSFSSNSVVGNSSFSNPNTGQNLVEGCSNASLTYSILAPLASALTITLYINPSGTATQADILPNPFPTEIVIPAGNLQTTPIQIVALSDGFSEGSENLVINATTQTCNVINTTTTEYTIKDLSALDVTLSDQVSCDGAPITLSPIVVGGQPILPLNVYHYLWNTSETAASITFVPPLGTNTYSVTITDACGQTSSTSSTVNAGLVPTANGPIAGQATICAPATGLTYTVPPMNGAESYTWTVPAGAMITSGGNSNSITVDFSLGASSGAITVKGTNGLCGPGVPVSLPVAVAPAPQAAGLISGLASLCVPASGVTYSTPAITGADSYIWTIPAGGTIVSGSNTNTITIDFGASASSGNITVKAHSNLCGDGQPSSLTITVNPTPQAAGPISGSNSICSPMTGVTYSIPPVFGAVTYTWTVPPGAVITSGSNSTSITVDYSLSTVSGNVTVSGANAFCGSGIPASLPVSVSPTPQAAGPVTGQALICTPVSGAVYSIAPVTGATSYQWSIPAGATIISGANSSAITVDFPLTSVSGNVMVLGSSINCGSGASSQLPVTVAPAPQAAGPISGPTTFCTPFNGVVFSVPAIIGADSYTWTLPPGAIITAGNGTHSITVDFPATASSGTLTVKAHSNVCGDGLPSSLTLAIHPSPEDAGTISGPATVCQGATGIVYSINALAYTTTYDWSVPSGVTIVAGSGTSQITCIFTASAVSGIISVRGYNADCNYGTASVKPVTVNTLPGTAGTITSPTGQSVCQGSTGVPYSVPAITGADTYIWTYSGSGATITNNGASILVDFSGTATPGNLMVKGRNSCGDGPFSAQFPVTVKLKPTAAFLVCNEMTTTKNGRPIVLSGGRPLGSGGTYSGTGVSLASPGVYVFDPSASGVTGGSTTTGNNYTITYRYTNTYGCFDEKTGSISVFASNANDPCPGTVKDYRDNRTYSTFIVGSGFGSRCWMAENLDYGTFTDMYTAQTDNCTIEKYCRNNASGQCATYGGYYQWGEIMQYRDTPGYQDICLAGWHVATAGEWDQMVAVYLGNGIAGGALKDMFSATGFHGLTEGVLYGNNLWSYASGTNTGSLFWTSDAGASAYSVARGLNSYNPSVSLYQSSRANAFPVRCVRN